MTFSHPQYSVFNTAPYPSDDRTRRSWVGGASPVDDPLVLFPPDIAIPGVVDVSFRSSSFTDGGVLPSKHYYSGVGDQDTDPSGTANCGQNISPALSWTIFGQPSVGATMELLVEIDPDYAGSSDPVCSGELWSVLGLKPESGGIAEGSGAWSTSLFINPAADGMTYPGSDDVFFGSAFGGLPKITPNLNGFSHEMVPATNGWFGPCNACNFDQADNDSPGAVPILFSLTYTGLDENSDPLTITKTLKAFY